MSGEIVIETVWSLLVYYKITHLFTLSLHDCEIEVEVLFDKSLALNLFLFSDEDLRDIVLPSSPTFNK